MIRENDLWKAAKHVVAESRLAILTTANAGGQPHATWMSTIVTDSLREVLTVTAPDTLKVRNMRQNPHSQWMFWSPSIETVIYLSGPTDIVEGEEAEEYWHRIPNKSQAYFRRHSNSDDHREFAVLRTNVMEAVYCRPPGYQKSVIFEAESPSRVVA